MFQNLFISVRRSKCFRPILLPAASLARLAAGSSNGLTNTRRCMCSFKLLLYSENILMMHGPMNVKVFVSLADELF